MDSPPESVLALSCEPPTISPTLPSLDNSPSPFQLSSFPCEEDNEEDTEEEGISIPPSPTPAVALFPGNQEGRTPSPDNTLPDLPLESPSLNEALPGFGALELALSSTQDPSDSDELDLQLFHNGRPTGKEGKDAGVDGGATQPTPPALKFPCKVCGKRFRFNSILSLHARAHTLERDRATFACQHCEFRTPHRAGLAVHLKSHHIREPELENLTLVEVPVVSSQATNKSLSPLDAQFLTGETMDLTEALMEETPAPASTEDSAVISLAAFRCHACKGKFRTASELSRHVRILHNPYKCTLCPFSATLEEDLAAHLQDSHPALSPPRIDVQPPVVSKVVPPLPAFRCETCGQRFTQSWFLKGHMRKHKDSLDHKCQVCGRGFKEAWFLKNHMKVHLNKLGLKANTGISLGRTVSDDQTKAPPGGQALGSLYSNLLLAHRDGGIGETGRHGRVEREALAKLAVMGGNESVSSNKSSLLGYLGLPSDIGGSSCMERLQAVAQVAEMGSSGSIGAGGATTSMEDQSAVWHMVAHSLAAAQQVQQQQRPRQRSQRSSVAGEAEQMRAYLGSLVSREGSKGALWECPDCGKLFRSLQQAVAHARVHVQKPQKEDEARKRDGGRTANDSRLDVSKSTGGQQKVAAVSLSPGAGGTFHPMMTHFQGENSLKGVSPIQCTSTRERVRGTGAKDCPYCGKSFRSSHHLKVHLRVHTGERPYKCPHCDYAGTQSGSLKYHLQRHHREQKASSGGSSISSASSSRSVSSATINFHEESSLKQHRFRSSSQVSSGNQDPTTAQQWPFGSSEHKLKNTEGNHGVPGDVETFHYLQRVIGGSYPSGIDAPWVNEAPQNKLAKISRRKPLTTNRMVSANSWRHCADAQGFQQGFEPLDLSQRPSPGHNYEEEGGAVTLSQCLFCPFRTSSAELMAMHLQVNHTSKSRRKREVWSHRVTPVSSEKPNFNEMAFWKSQDDRSKANDDWAASSAVALNGLSVEEETKSSINTPELETNSDMEYEQDEGDEEIDYEEYNMDPSKERDSSSVASSRFEGDRSEEASPLTRMSTKD